MLSDANADVIALTDAIGRVVAQHGYTPYGDLLAAERFVPGSDSLASESHAAAIGSRLGHQGLRTERFDRPWDGPLDLSSAVPIGTDATGSYRSLCHNRNRLYDPAEGRFTGNDPNGLGLPVLSGTAFGGVAPSAFDVDPNIGLHHADGLNTHAAYHANPRASQDPSGLFIDPADIAGMAVMGVVRGLRGGLEAIVSVYADNQDYDLDWAMDWGLPDDWNTRTENTWVAQAWNEGVRGGLEAWLEEDVIGSFGVPVAGIEQFAGRYGPGVTPPGPAWRAAARAVNAAGYVAHHVISFYKATARRMKNIEQKYGFDFDLHSLDNMLPLKPSQHGFGRHRHRYHNRVFTRLEDKLKAAGKYGNQAKRVFLNELEQIKRDIERNPSQWFGQ